MEALGGNAVGGQGGFGFSAKPQVVTNKAGGYRDPYREYVKVAPQNIMYDRRVVRGNTFAALVIPVNMQPDPAMIERQKHDQMLKQQRTEQMRKRREDEQRRVQMMQNEEQQRTQQMDQEHENTWDELSDYENQVDEMQLEPDYYIDRPMLKWKLFSRYFFGCKINEINMLNQFIENQSIFPILIFINLPVNKKKTEINIVTFVQILTIKTIFEFEYQNHSNKYWIIFYLLK